MKRKAMFSTIFMLACFLLLLSSFSGACASPGATSKPSLQVPSGPKYGGTLRLSYASSPLSLDTAMSLDNVSPSLAKLYNTTVVTWDGRDDSDARIVPWAAKSWDISADAMVITYHLNEGIKWQNIPPVHGRELTSADFKYSIERIMNPATRSPLRPYVANVDRIETPDKYTIKYYYNEPNFNALVGAAAGSSVPTAKEIVEAYGGAHKVAVGCGPFILEEHVVNSRIILRKNPDYFEKNKPYLDRVEFSIVPDEAQRVAAFRAGRLDRMLGTFNAVRQIKATNPDAVIIPGVNTNGVALYFGIQYKPEIYGNQKVRQAIRAALDCDGMVKAALEGDGFQTGYLSKQFVAWGAPLPENLPKRDVTKAKKLLAEAGYPNGFKVNFLASTAAEVNLAAVEIITAQLKEVGIDCKIQMMERAMFQAQMRSGEFEMLVAGARFEKPDDPDNDLYPQFWTQGTANRGKYSNPKVDELLDLQRKAGSNTDLRKRIIKDILAILEEDVPVVPIYVSYSSHILQPWVKGWENVADGNDGLGIMHIRNVWLDK